ncbi:MAG: hypothetical protein UU49_C0040G0004 [Candidatus Magasanikbacteria bacterium GW2011_GWC2_41_17]|nr:MAG: hypothetical protein UU49_C0040G0004 [Candidatus Magasanikbacteria bacterium GW2011_GWC2_41_17]
MRHCKERSDEAISCKLRNCFVSFAMTALVALTFLLAPSSVFAAAPSVINLPNPLGTTNILDLGARLIKAGLGIAGSLALLFFIYGGFLWLTSGGSPDKIKKGKDVFLWSVVGLVIIFSSYLMVDFVIKALTKGAADNKSQCVNNALEESGVCLAKCPPPEVKIGPQPNPENETSCIQDCLQKNTEANEKCTIK